MRKVYSTGNLQTINTLGNNGRSESPLSQENGTIDGMNKVGRYSAEERKERIERYRSKRNQRSFTKKFKHDLRQLQLNTHLGNLNVAMGSTRHPHPTTEQEIRAKFKFPEHVKIVLTKKLSEVAPCGFTCITVGQLEDGLKIPLYHPDRPLQYEVLRLLSKAPGQMTGSFYRTIEGYENHNKEHPESKVSAEQIKEFHYLRRSKSYPNCYSFRKKYYNKITPCVSSYDHRYWDRFPIFISGPEWIHLRDLPPPPDKYFNPIIWRCNENEEANTTTGLSSDDEEEEILLPVSNKRQKKVSEASTTQVGIGSSNGICDFSSANIGNLKVEGNIDPPIQSVVDNHQVDNGNGPWFEGFSIAANKGNPKVESNIDPPIQSVVDNHQVDNGNGPWFEDLEGESKLDRIRNWEDLIYIGNFPVKEKFAELYRKIWKRHGHLARRDVIKTSFMLVVNVSDLLECITAMETTKLVDIDDVKILDDWDTKIAYAEGLNFNVGWLRKHFDQAIMKTKDAACSLTISLETHKAALSLALQTQSTMQTRADNLKVQLEELEQKLSQVNLDVSQHRQALSFFQKTFLQDAI